MVTKDDRIICDKCGSDSSEIHSVTLGNIMKFDLCDNCERNLELIVIDFIHGVKE